jgi:hypothetical protein
MVNPDGSCDLLDYGPDSYEAVPAGDTASPRIYAMDGDKECEWKIFKDFFNSEIGITLIAI